MGLHNFLKFCTDFEIIPHLISKKDVFIIFRSTLVDTIYEDITLDEFEETLIKCASVAYAKHPYNVKYLTLAEKVAAFLERTGSPDWSKIRKKMDKLGFTAPLNPQRLMQNFFGLNSAQDLNKILNNSFTTELPPPDELEAELRDIFGFYVEYGGTFTKDHLSSQQFMKIIRDCDVVDNSLRDVDVDLVFIESTRVTNGVMTFEVFLDALSMVAAKKWSSNNPAASLKLILLHFILPKAHRRNAKAMADKEPLHPEVIPYLKKHEQPLRKIFNKFCTLELLMGKATAKEIANANQTMSIQELLRLCHDFDLCPALLSVSEINDIFNICNVSNQQEDDGAFNFDEFLECLARMAEKAYIGAWDELYKTPLERVKALLDRMDIMSAVRLNERLRRLDAFSAVKVAFVK